jgi:hypothetical protein
MIVVVVVVVGNKKGGVFLSLFKKGGGESSNPSFWSRVNNGLVMIMIVARPDVHDYIGGPSSSEDIPSSSSQLTQYPNWFEDTCVSGE